MDVLGKTYAYTSSSEDDGDHRSSETPQPLIKRPKIESAPDVSIEETALNKFYPEPSDMTIYHNIPFEDLAKPMAGPQNPFRYQAELNKNIYNGHVEEAVIDNYAFEVQHRSYLSLGYANDPNITAAVGVGADINHTIIGDYNKALELRGEWDE
jgi:pre-mRNA-processing factor 17